MKKILAVFAAVVLLCISMQTSFGLARDVSCFECRKNVSRDEVFTLSFCTDCVPHHTCFYCKKNDSTEDVPLVRIGAHWWHHRCHESVGLLDMLG